MTTLRRQRFGLRAMLLWAILLAIPAAFVWQAGYAATTEQVVADPNTGLAIYGYDPVAYFTDRAAKVGREDLELKHGGVAWRFSNPGNRDAFKEDPDVYMPQYGGHDAVGITLNMARAGHPDFWVIHKEKLFLFYSEEARKAFRVNPENVALQAEVNWPHVREQLAP